MNNTFLPLALFLLIGGMILPLFADAAERVIAPPDNNNIKTESAVFAGGCFWCLEADFQKLPGVLEAVSGYTGGTLRDPTYEQVCSGATGHIEAVKVIYDPTRVSYAQLLEYFWRHIDPTDDGGQFVDRGTQYRSAIFYADETQRRLAVASKEKLAATAVFDKPLATAILPMGDFYAAEAYHQDFYQENPAHYQRYRSGSGRDRFLERAWADKPQPARGDTAAAQNDADRDHQLGDRRNLRQRLTPLQYKVTQENGTETAFDNPYWDNQAEGIYVDIVSGEPLFSSTDKFDSGTGWPSFSRPLKSAGIITRSDHSFFTERTEVRSKQADSHLGHLFNDGPPPDGLRYCINSAALRFIPRTDLVKEGYARYQYLFE